MTHGSMYTTVAGGRRRYSRAPQRTPVRAQVGRVRLERLSFTMGVVAFHSGQLEGAAWDRWELHRDALHEAYTLGTAQKPVTIYHFLKWHGAILPCGGTLREANPVSMHMGESFAPHNYRTLPQRAGAFMREWAEALSDTRDPWLTLARLHFTQWQMHPFADGNKRHSRLMTVYGCGWYGLPAVCITLAVKQHYLDALNAADVPALARLFESNTIGSE